MSQAQVPVTSNAGFFQQFPYPVQSSHHGVVPGQQSSPQFIIQPQMPHMAVPNVGAGGNPGAGGPQGQGQMQPPPQWGGYFVEEESPNIIPLPQIPNPFYPIPFITYTPIPPNMVPMVQPHQPHPPAGSVNQPQPEDGTEAASAENEEPTSESAAPRSRRPSSVNLPPSPEENSEKSSELSNISVIKTRPDSDKLHSEKNPQSEVVTEAEPPNPAVALTLEVNSKLRQQHQERSPNSPSSTHSLEGVRFQKNQNFHPSQQHLRKVSTSSPTSSPKRPRINRDNSRSPLFYRGQHQNNRPPPYLRNNNFSWPHTQQMHMVDMSLLKQPPPGHRGPHRGAGGHQPHQPQRTFYNSNNHDHPHQRRNQTPPSRGGYYRHGGFQSQQPPKNS